MEVSWSAADNGGYAAGTAKAADITTGVSCGGGNNFIARAEYKVVTTTQSGACITLSWTGTQFWLATSDAFVKG